MWSKIQNRKPDECLMVLNLESNWFRFYYLFYLIGFDIFIEACKGNFCIFGGIIWLMVFDYLFRLLVKLSQLMSK